MVDTSTINLERLTKLQEKVNFSLELCNNSDFGEILETSFEFELITNDSFKCIVEYILDGKTVVFVESSDFAEIYDRIYHFDEIVEFFVNDMHY